jgi:hypothetical protein
MTNKEIIKALDELDLSSYPYDEVKRYLGMMTAMTQVLSFIL